MRESETRSVEVSASAFLRDFTELSEFGRTSARGVDRQAATKNDRRCRQWLMSWLSDHGARVSVDEIGNIFGTWEYDPGGPHVLVGSHLDSQPTAGRFDGAYGVLAAAHAAGEIARRVQDGRLPRPSMNVTVVDWFNEEGSRFGPSLMGSKVFTHQLDLEACLAARDSEGTTLHDALSDIGHYVIGHPPVASAYVEIHVEQGRILEDHGCDIGGVESNWAVAKFTAVLIGEQNHTGTAPLKDRRDALLGAAKSIEAIRTIASQNESESVLGSVGRLDVYPNVPGVVPSRVSMAVDLRAEDSGLLKAVSEEVVAKIHEICVSEGLTIDIPEFPVREAVEFPQSGIAITRAACERAGLTFRLMKTRAGHDSISMNAVVPTIMMFIPSSDGVSHSEKEYTEDRDMLNGVDVLTEVLVDLVASRSSKSDDFLRSYGAGSQIRVDQAAVAKADRDLN